MAIPCVVQHLTLTTTTTRWPIFLKNSSSLVLVRRRTGSSPSHVSWSFGIQSKSWFGDQEFFSQLQVERKSQKRSHKIVNYFYSKGVNESRLFETRIVWRGFKNSSPCKCSWNDPLSHSLVHLPAHWQLRGTCLFRSRQDSALTLRCSYVLLGKEEIHSCSLIGWKLTE